MIKRNIKKLNLSKVITQSLATLGLVILVVPQICFGATVLERLRNVVVSKPTYDYDKTSENTLTDYLGNIVGVFLGLLGTIFVILIVYAGYTWMMASGNAEKVSKAQGTIKSAVLGLVITVAVYAIWIFIFARIVKT